MISIAKNFEKEKLLTVEDITYGDSFTILSIGWDSVYLKCDNDTFVEIPTGSVFDAEDYNYLPVRKIDFTLVEK